MCIRDRNDTSEEKLEDNSDKALVTVVHCSNDIKNIIEGVCIDSLVPSLCVPEGAKKEHSKDQKSSTTF